MSQERSIWRLVACQLAIDKPRGGVLKSSAASVCVPASPDIRSKEPCETFGGTANSQLSCTIGFESTASSPVSIMPAPGRPQPALCPPSPSPELILQPATRKVPQH
ncbi:hypothetical protein PABG_11312 [Paracoccidioides brasiliensis Pb03]|nr:hypothetical protein PABG_11312 [Paracoccidioides brasiliensis Pb03]